MMASGPRINPRLYQPSLSKHKMKVNRYSVSGASQRKGMEAMFCVM